MFFSEFDGKKSCLQYCNILNHNSCMIIHKIPSYSCQYMVLLMIKWDYYCVCSVGGDDFLVVHTRDDLAALHGTTPYTHSSPGTPINMPWLGGMQTGRGASVVSVKLASLCGDSVWIRKSCLLNAHRRLRRLSTMMCSQLFISAVYDLIWAISLPQPFTFGVIFLIYVLN